MATLPSNSATVRRNASPMSLAGGQRVAAHHDGDDLGVGGDRGVDRQVVGDLQIGVVVDVAVEHGDGVRALRATTGLVAVHRVAVRFADDPDARPPRVAEHRQPGGGRIERCAQEVVGGDRGAQRADVVAELADLGGGLVDEAERLAGEAHARRSGTADRCRAARSRRRRRGRRRRARGPRRTRAARPSRARAPPSGRSTTAPAGWRGSRRRRPARRPPRRAHRPPRRCAAGRGAPPSTRRAARSARRWPARARPPAAARRRAPARARRSVRRAGRAGR